jgi:hypothetical protein
MTTAELKAAEAWKLVAHKPTIFSIVAGREPMPPGQAIDYVQDETGDRDDAVSELLKAAANWLAAKAPPGNAVNLGDDALVLLGDIRGEDFGHADAMWGTISLRAQGTAQDVLAGMWRNFPDSPSLTQLDAWRLWAQEAMRVIGLCRWIVAAAYPEPV